MGQMVRRICRSSSSCNISSLREISRFYRRNSVLFWLDVGSSFLYFSQFLSTKLKLLPLSFFSLAFPYISAKKNGKNGTNIMKIIRHIHMTKWLVALPSPFFDHHISRILIHFQAFFWKKASKVSNSFQAEIQPQIKGHLVPGPAPGQQHGAEPRHLWCPKPGAYTIPSARIPRAARQWPHCFWHSEQQSPPKNKLCLKPQWFKSQAYKTGQAQA